MAVSTLRPNGTTINDGSVTGAANAHAALSDDSDSSYVTLDPVSVIGATWAGGMDNLTLPAGALIKSVALRARLSLTFAPGTPCSIRGYIELGAGQVSESLFVNTPSGAPQTYTIGTWNAVGNTDAEVDGATVIISHESGGAFRAYEAYMDVTHVAQPFVSATAPTSTITTTNMPLVEWTDTLDTDGGAQTVWQVRVFTDAQYGAGGFDPGVSAATAEGSGTTAATSWRVDEPLADDTYRAYVWVAQTVNGVRHWSEPDYAEFTVDVDLPATPTINVTPIDSDASMIFSLTTNSGVATTDILEFQRSVNGTTWEPLRTLEGDDGYFTLPYVVATGEYSDSSDGTSHALVLPAPYQGIRAGDLLVAVVAMDGNPTMTWPSGWTKLKDEAGNGSAVRAGVAYKWADGGETGTVTLTTSASEGGGARILCIRGADPDTPPEVSAGVSSAAANANPDSLDPAGWGAEFSLFIAAMVNDGNVAVTAAPSGYFGFGNTRWANASGAGVATATLLALEGADPGAFTHAAEDTRAFTIGVRAINGSLELNDFEAPNGVETQYRARALHDYNGEYAASAWTTDTATWTSSSWWLKHPNQPDLNTEVTVRTVSPISRAGRQGVFQPIGSTSAIVVQDTRAPGTGQFVLRALTEEAQADLDALLDESATLMLQSPDGDGGPDYVRVLGHTRSRIVEGLADASRVWEEIEFVQVTTPTGAVVAWP